MTPNEERSGDSDFYSTCWSLCKCLFALFCLATLILVVSGLIEGEPTQEERMQSLEERWDNMTPEEKGEAIADELRQTNPELFR